MSAPGTLTEAGLEARLGQPAELLIRSARVLDPVAGIDGAHDIVVRDGRIAELAPPGSAAPVEGIETIEAEGLHAFPAFFDPHVHLRTPGQEHKEDLETGSRSAAAGGYCGVIAMANTVPPVSTAGDVSALRRRATREAIVPLGFAATVTVGMEGDRLTEMSLLREAGALAFSDDGLPIRDAGMLRRALQYQRLCGGVIALHEEDPSLSAGGAMHEGEVSALLGLPGIPSLSETTMIERDIAIAGYEAAAIHIQHVSAAESVEVVARAKDGADGRLQVTAEASPHHLCLSDEAVRSLDPNRHKMNPPLRAERDRKALIEGLRDGTLDCVATDHAPHAPEDKQVPFEEAAMGVIGLEVAFAALHTELVLGGTLSLATLVERMTAGAEPFEVPRPTLAPGAEANIAICDLGMEWTAGEEGYESRSDNCWCDGYRLIGRPVVTVAAGRVAYRLRSFSMGVA